MESQAEAARLTAKQQPVMALAEMAEYMVESTMGKQLESRRTVEPPPRYVGRWLSRKSGIGSGPE